MKLPGMRLELISCLESLSDIEYQKECWVKGVCPGNVEYDNFDLSVHFLFDDTDLHSNPESLIGFILKDKNEAGLVHAVCQRIDDIFTRYGTHLSDEEYINCPEWAAVVLAAKRAHIVISGS